MTFAEKLDTALQRHGSLLWVGLDPNPELLPEKWQQPSGAVSQALYDWLAWVISQTQDQVCAYKPTLGFYLALGQEGIELLHAVLKIIPSHLPIILDAKHSDLNTASYLAKTFFEQWQVDAVTVNPYAGQEAVTPFLLYPQQAVFVLTHTSNPSATKIQSYPTADAPLWLEVVKAVKGWGSPDQLGLEVGAANPLNLEQVRQIAPERTILARSIWSESVDLSVDLKVMLQAGLNSSGTGLLLPVPQDWLAQPDLGHQVQRLRDEVSELRSQIVQQPTTCELRLPTVGQGALTPQQNLILELFDLGCILFGSYVQASGATLPYYIDLRRIISNPQLFHQVLEAYATLTQPLTFDRIAGIPYGSLPTATGLALKLHHPMIYPRKEVKAHGTRRLVEGDYESGERVLVIDDVLITGKSVLEGIRKLETAGLQVMDVVVLIDHEGGVRDKIQAQGYNAHAVFTLSDIARTLYDAARITEEQYGTIVHPAT
jgi:uridine monophosphate synthetase